MRLQRPPRGHQAAPQHQQAPQPPSRARPPQRLAQRRRSSSQLPQHRQTRRRSCQACPPRPQYAHRPDHAVRAGHQCAAARPQQPVPLRRARHLPAHGGAGRAGQPQEGHDRSGAQRPPGQPHAGLPGCLPARRRSGKRPAAQCHGPAQRHRHAVLPDQPAGCPLPESLPQGKADNQILGVVAALREQHKDREVVLVSKDINMRVKARALGLAAEDYQNDKVLEDGDLLYSAPWPCPTTSGPRPARMWRAGRKAPSPTTASAAPSSTS
jgi:hypothetical protein